MGYTNLREITEEASKEAKRLIGEQGRKSQPFRNRFEHHNARSNQPLSLQPKAVISKCIVSSVYCFMMGGPQSTMFNREQN